MKCMVLTNDNCNYLLAMDKIRYRGGLPKDMYIQIDNISVNLKFDVLVEFDWRWTSNVRRMMNSSYKYHK